MLELYDIKNFCQHKKYKSGIVGSYGGMSLQKSYNLIWKFLEVLSPLE